MLLEPGHDYAPVLRTKICEGVSNPYFLFWDFLRVCHVKVGNIENPIVPKSVSIRDPVPPVARSGVLGQ